MAYTPTGVADYDRYLYNLQKKPTTQQKYYTPTGNTSNKVTYTPTGVPEYDSWLYNNQKETPAGGGGGGNQKINTTLDENPITPTVETLPTVTGEQPVYPGTPGPSTSPTSTASMADILGMIDSWMTSQKKSKTDSMQSLLNSSLGNLDTQENNISGVYYDKTRQAQANSDISGLNFAQYMASRGIKGSAGGMPEIYRNIGFQNAKTTLDNAEAAEKAGIEQQRTTLRNNSARDLEAALSDIDSQGFQQRLTATQQNNALALDQAQLAKSDSQQAMSNALAAANITGIYDGMSKWWTPDEITAAETNWKTANTPKTTYSGTKTSDQLLSYPQLVSTLDGIYTKNNDKYTGLSDAGKKQIYDLIQSSGGKYASVLMQAYIPGYTTSAPATTTGGGNTSDAVLANARKMLTTTPSDGNVSAVIQRVVDYLDGSGLSETDIAIIMKQLGLG
jgi:hypothetical protein